MRALFSVAYSLQTITSNQVRFQNFIQVHAMWHIKMLSRHMKLKRGPRILNCRRENIKLSLNFRLKRDSFTLTLRGNTDHGPCPYHIILDQWPSRTEGVGSLWSGYSPFPGHVTWTGTCQPLPPCPSSDRHNSKTLRFPSYYVRGR